MSSTDMAPNSPSVCDQEYRTAPMRNAGLGHVEGNSSDPSGRSCHIRGVSYVRLHMPRKRVVISIAVGRSQLSQGLGLCVATVWPMAETCDQAWMYICAKASMLMPILCVRSREGFEWRIVYTTMHTCLAIWYLCMLVLLAFVLGFSQRGRSCASRARSPFNRFFAQCDRPPHAGSRSSARARAPSGNPIPRYHGEIAAQVRDKGAYRRAPACHQEPD